MLDVKTFYRSLSLRATQRCLRPAALLTSCSVLAILQACSSTPKPFQPDLFSTTASPYAHSFVATNAQACEAARRAMLSQGYTTTAATADAVDANKGFQPGPEVHVVVSFHVVCTPSESANGSSTLYVNAVQDNYGLKKSDTSATVGLSILGSVSLPIRSNNDSMVKFSSQTIPPGPFYDRFFALVDHYLKNVVRSSPVGDDASIVESPLPTPATVLSRSAPPIPVEVGGASAPGGPNVTPLAPVQASPATPASGASSASGASASSAASAAGSAPVTASEATPASPPAKHAGKANSSNSANSASAAASSGANAAASTGANTAANPAAPASSAAAPASVPATSASAPASAPAAASAGNATPDASPSPHATAKQAGAASSSAAASSPSAASDVSSSQNGATAAASTSASTPSAASAASAPTTP